MSKQLKLLLSAGLVIGLALVWALSDDQSSRRSIPSNQAHGKPQTSQAGSPGSFHGANDTNYIEKTLVELRQAKTPELTRSTLAALKAYLTSIPPESAEALIKGYLDRHTDISTHLDFTVGLDGFVGDASSLRVFFLDILARINLQSAGIESKKILQSMNSPDEWAVSLRNIAWADPGPQGQDYLRQKIGQMIQNREWQRKPTAGFLEAFDVLVYAHATNLTPTLSAMVHQNDNRAIRHAAYLSLDGLVIQDTSSMLKAFNSQPDLFNQQERTRADFFARADVADPSQRSQLEIYLSDPRRSVEELNAFAAVYPNANYMISRNLLTHATTPDGATQNARDNAALGVVRQWFQDPRYARLKPQLELIQSRLATFQQQFQGAQ